MKRTLIRTKNFVLRHRGVIVTAAVMGSVVALQSLTIKQHVAFLEHKGLSEEFMNPLSGN